jgi:hypothetical protein
MYEWSGIYPDGVWNLNILNYLYPRPSSWILQITQLLFTVGHNTLCESIWVSEVSTSRYRSVYTREIPQWEDRNTWGHSILALRFQESGNATIAANTANDDIDNMKAFCRSPGCEQSHRIKKMTGPSWDIATAISHLCRAHLLTASIPYPLVWTLFRNLPFILVGIRCKILVISSALQPHPRGWWNWWRRLHSRVFKNCSRGSRNW